MADHTYGRKNEKHQRTPGKTGSQCFAINCTNQQNKTTKEMGISFHRYKITRRVNDHLPHEYIHTQTHCDHLHCRFPNPNASEESRLLFEEWVRNCRRGKTKPTRRTLVCSVHFTDDALDRTGQTTRLRKNAVPTKFDLSKHPVSNI